MTSHVVYYKRDVHRGARTHLDLRVGLQRASLAEVLGADGQVRLLMAVEGLRFVKERNGAKGSVLMPSDDLEICLNTHQPTAARRTVYSVHSLLESALGELGVGHLDLQAPWTARDLVRDGASPSMRAHLLNPDGFSAGSNL